jgi:hypothetical protein
MLFIASHRNRHIARPIRHIKTLSDIAMKSGILPIRDPFDIAVFQRVDMDIIDMTLIIRLITNQMFPIVALPYPAFASRYSYL